jgi:hypothetical protein
MKSNRALSNSVFACILCIFIYLNPEGMSASKASIVNFEVLLDDSFMNHNTDSSIAPVSNKNLLSIVNGFEDGKWRSAIFQKFIWDNISETALSFSERAALIAKPQSSLVESAKKLRLTDANKSTSTEGSELAEILLYGIMKHHYHALPVVPKIFYKQNSQDNAKGADSVHIVLTDGDDFTIWFGEAKFYNSIEDVRLNEVIASVEKALQTDKLKKENSIITNVSDLDKLLPDKSALVKRIKNLLSPQESIDLLKPKLHIPILLLHECEITAKGSELSDAYRKEILNHHKSRAVSFYKKQVDKLSKKVFKYDSIHFHIIFFPVPKKDPVIQKFLENVSHYKNQS